MNRMNGFGPVKSFRIDHPDQNWDDPVPGPTFSEIVAVTERAKTRRRRLYAAVWLVAVAGIIVALVHG